MAASRGQGQQGGEATQPLPPSSGREVMLNACVQCHSFRVIVMQRKTEEAWRLTVNDMIVRGAPLIESEAEILASYLAKSFGPDSPLPQQSHKEESGETSAKSDLLRLSDLPFGEGRSLVITKCTRCHGLQEVVNLRKSRVEWNLSIRQMIKLGAKLTAEEISIIEIYLSRSFGQGELLPRQEKGK
jgi:hypothetical protein